MVTYYTTDGTDPRESQTGAATGTLYTHSEEISSVTLVNTSSPCQVKIPTNGSDFDSWRTLDFDDSNWLSGTNGVGYETSGSDYQSLINFDIQSMKGVNESAYIRIPFNLSQANATTSLTLNMKYDDAFVAYINGQEVARSINVPATLGWNSGADSYRPDSSAVVYQSFNLNNAINTLQEGANVLAVHLLNSGLESSDILCVPLLTATQSMSAQDGVIIEGTVDFRVRAKLGQSWSALNQAVFSDQKVRENLRITEIMYNPANSGGEFIELKNIGTETIDLYLCTFTDGIDFTFPNIDLAAGDTILVVEDESEFLDIYASSSTSFNIAGEFQNGSKLSNGGEEIVLRDALGIEIHDFDYEDLYPITDGLGHSIYIKDPLNENLDAWDILATWSPSRFIGGSPNEEPSNSSALAFESIVINEILAHSDSYLGNRIELHNTTTAPIDIGGWF